MPFQSHLRDFSTPKICKGTCADCPKRLAEAYHRETPSADSRQIGSHMGRSLPQGAPEVLSDLRHRVHDRFLASALVDAAAAEQGSSWDGRL